jgi:ABC-2 type transport system permease protein
VKTIRQIIIKEFLQLRADKRMLPIMIIAPILQVILLGYAATVDVKNISLVVCDLDNTRESREYLTRYTNTGYFTVVEYLDKPEEIDDYLDRSKAIMGVVIPKNFGRKIQSGTPTQVQLIADGADANTANISIGYASQITAGYAQSILLERTTRAGGLRLPAQVLAQTRVWYNPDLRSANFMVPGVVAMVLMIVTTTFAAAAIVREKEIGTMEQLMVTPIKPHELIIGKLLPFIIIGAVDVGLVLGVAVLWFSIPLKGSVLLLYGLSGLFILTTLGLGLFVSTISNTQQQALMTAQFFIFFPFIFLSGFTFPIANMPQAIQVLTYFVPLRYFLEIIRGLFLKGVGIETLWPQAVTLLGFGIVILSLAVMRFQKRLG